MRKRNAKTTLRNYSTDSGWHVVGHTLIICCVYHTCCPLVFIVVPFRLWKNGWTNEWTTWHDMNEWMHECMQEPASNVGGFMGASEDLNRGTEPNKNLPAKPKPSPLCHNDARLQRVRTASLFCKFNTTFQSVRAWAGGLFILILPSRFCVRGPRCHEVPHSFLLAGLQTFVLRSGLCCAVRNGGSMEDLWASLSRTKSVLEIQGRPKLK